MPEDPSPYFIHATAEVEPGATVGAGTKVWRHCHVVSGARLGPDCSLGQGCYVAGGAVLGRGVRIQNHVSLYDGVTLEDEVFVGPAAVFTNVRQPRAHVSRRHAYTTTLVRRGATIGANATILSGVTIGEYAFVGAGAVVTKDVPAYALMVGTPARRIGWMCRCGVRLGDASGEVTCPECGAPYKITETACIPKN